MDHDFNVRDFNAGLAKLEAPTFALTCMQTFVGARVNALRYVLRTYFEEEGIDFHATDSFDEFFKGIEDASLDGILSGFADDDAGTAAEMKAWLEKVRA